MLLFHLVCYYFHLVSYYSHLVCKMVQKNYTAWQSKRANDSACVIMHNTKLVLMVLPPELWTYNNLFTLAQGNPRLRV